MTRKTLFVSALAFAFAAQLAHAGPTAANGGIMTDQGGMTLYTFDKDEPGRSNCSGECLKKWPAFIAKADAPAGGDYGLIGRAEGGLQWTFKGKPLYYFAGDQAAGERKGDGLNGVWHVIDAGQAAAPKDANPGRASGFGSYGY